MPSGNDRRVWDENYFDWDTDHYDAPSDKLMECERRQAEIRLGYLQRLLPGKDVLDLCCGFGRYLTPFCEQTNNTVGVDYSKSMIHRCRNRINDKGLSNAEVVTGDAHHLPFKDDSFDVVYSYTSLYYVQDVKTVIEEISRLLRPGGRAILEFGNRHSLGYWYSWVQAYRKGWGQVRSDSYSSIIKHVESAGFKVLDRHAFQILLQIGNADSRWYVKPLYALKRTTDIKIMGTTIDEILSNNTLLRRFAYYHYLYLENG